MHFHREESAYRAGVIGSRASALHERRCDDPCHIYERVTSYGGREVCMGGESRSLHFLPREAACERGGMARKKVRLMGRK